MCEEEKSCSCCDEQKLIVLYEQAVAMYLHEDGMAAGKVNQAIYANAAVAAGIGLAGRTGYSAGLSLGGVGICVFFLISLYCGRRFQINRRAMAHGLATMLYPGLDPKYVPGQPAKLKLSTYAAMSTMLFTAVAIWVACSVFFIVSPV